MEIVAGVNTDITVLINHSYLVAVRWPAGRNVCTRAKVICCVRRVWASSLCRQRVCGCMCVLKFVLVTEGKEAPLIFFLGRQ